MEKITSLQNEYIKQLCKLKTPAGRREAGLFLAEGNKVCIEVLRSGLEIDRCLVTEKELQNPILQETGNKCIVISDHIAKKLSTMDTVPGIFLVVKQRELPFSSSPRFVLALDHISDPSNLGAILRSAEAFGVDSIFLSDGSVDPYSPKVLRAAMGSIFRSIIQKGDLPHFLTQKKTEGYKVYGAGLNRNYLELPDVSFDSQVVMVIGNESNGITEEVMSFCDHGVFIPMLGQNESLNAAVAASIILWEQSKWK